MVTVTVMVTAAMVTDIETAENRRVREVKE
jgi:hypothetical protein